MNRLGLKISCILVSILIWIQVASTADIEQTTDLPLRVAGLAEGLTVAGSDNLPPKVRVRVTGSKFQLLTHQYFNRYIGEVRVNLAGFRDTTIAYRLDRSHIITDMKDADIHGSRILTLTIDQEKTRPVPVSLDREGFLAPGLVFVIPPRTDPDSVVVTGPSRYFSDDLMVLTESVNLGRISGDVQRTLNLLEPGEHLELAQDKVGIHFRVGKLETRTMANIPVIGLVDAGRPEVGISPPVADVVVKGFADSLRVLTEDRISVIVTVGNRTEGIYFLEGEVVHLDWPTSIELIPAQFQVIVGNPPSLWNDTPPSGRQEGQVD
jgi:YbbR domain-containing protein